MNLIRELKVFMKDNGYSYRDVAERFGYSHKSAISHWFKRKRIPPNREKDVRKFVGKK